MRRADTVLVLRRRRFSLVLCLLLFMFAQVLEHQDNHAAQSAPILRGLSFKPLPKIRWYTHAYSRFIAHPCTSAFIVTRFTALYSMYMMCYNVHNTGEF